MDLTRREFVKCGLATLGFLALPGWLFAAPAVWKPKKKSNLVFGVLADTHMRCGYDGVKFYEHNGSIFDDQAIVIALKHFKRHGVDAVLHLGDITDCGMVREMEFYKEAFEDVFGKRGTEIGERGFPRRSSSSATTNLWATRGIARAFTARTMSGGKTRFARMSPATTSGCGWQH